MKETSLVFIIIIISTLLLLYGVDSLSISYKEAVILFEERSLLHYLVYFSTKLFGQNDLALRLPFIIFHIFSLVLLYKIGKLFLKRKLDRVASVALYAMLPGVNSVAVLVNSAYITIFFTLLFLYFYMYKYRKISFLVLIITLFIDNSFAILYFSLIFYSIFNKEKQLFALSLILFGFSMSLYGFDTGGKPKGYFLDALGVYATVFSLFVFLYLIYALYRILIKEEKNLLWYISFFTLVLSLILSLRQRLLVEDFIAFVVISTPLLIKVFLNSYRVRLPQHRKYHNITFGIVSIFLILNLAIIYFNKPLYHFLKEPTQHAAYKHHVVKDLVEVLKSKNINHINVEDKKLALRLKFYGIENGGTYKLMHTNSKEKESDKIDIKYYNKVVKSFYLYR
ncbi:MAG: glycosyltransferase family 39 protein [Sulfurospirillum sp.]|nr:glycosyltransferase family 39 protein [Sulfurospirillum sp.]MBL0703837.1 glycosyltransferase family 39 protein [Sulfurospirillum sp.]